MARRLALRYHAIRIGLMRLNDRWDPRPGSHANGRRGLARARPPLAMLPAPAAHPPRGLELRDTRRQHLVVELRQLEAGGDPMGIERRLASR